ncbi:MAG: molybdenum cofactor guanylyltransferase MobA [Woeseiaceae bacterium]
MPLSESRCKDVTAVILAGGRATRMGGVDKGLISVNDRPMIAWVIDALRPQVADILISANRNRDDYAEFGFPVIDDGDDEFRGPLAGLASCMQVARTPYIALAPCDSPLLSGDLVPRLYTALSATGSRIAVAHDGNRLQPVFALLDNALVDDLTGYLDGGGRKIDQWYARHGYLTVDFSDVTESFANINAPDDQQALADKLALCDRT